MLKIAHFGAYGTNIGDTVALDNIRLQISKHIDETIVWVPINIIGFLDCKNDKSYILKTFRELTKGCSALFIGGGGLLEGGPFNDTYTGWKLPFSDEIFEELELDIPIYVIGVGINYFRSVAGFTEKGVKGLTSLINKAAIFSLRNDGSMDAAKEMLPPSVFEKIIEVPDPGLIYDYEYERLTIDEIQNKVMVLQPAFNGGQNIMLGRFLNNDNFNKIIRMPVELGLKILPHTPKDYMHFPLHMSGYNVVWDKQHFQQYSSIDSYQELLKYYKEIGCSIAMRGHGQMIALALNVPSIYFSTQDKVLNFSKRNNLMDFNVDIAEEGWYIKLNNLFTKLTTDEDFLHSWYETRDKVVSEFQNQFEHLCCQITQDLFKK
jgi:polysaccharide pyruvyl transferase WcaK-like protein